MEKIITKDIPLISVIVPVYKVEKYLSKCVDSILAQTYTNLEIILVDDGSPDNCGIICDEYAQKDSRIKVIHKENGGVSSARNVGLNYSSGEYIAFIDSDDYVVFDYIECLYSYFEKDIDIVISTAQIINPKNGKTKVWNDIPDTKVYTIDNSFNFLCTRSNFAVWGKLFKRSSINNCRFKEDVFLGEDSLFLARVISKCKKVKYIPLIIYNYYELEDSLSHGIITEKKLTVLEAWKEICMVFSGISASKTSCLIHYVEICCWLYYDSVLTTGRNSQSTMLIYETLNSLSSQIDSIKDRLSIKLKVKYCLLTKCRTIYNSLIKVLFFLRKLGRI